MKIAFLGNFRVDYTSETHYLKTLQRLGHEVIAIQEGSAELAVNKESFFKNLATIDMFFWVHTHGWKTEGLSKVMQIIRTNNIPVVGYHLDLWKGLKREKDLETDDYWKYLTHFFTCDKLFIPDLEERGIKAYFLPAGVFQDECYLGDWKEYYNYDVIFVGSKTYHPEWPYRTQLINWLEKKYGKRFALFGMQGVNKAQIRGKELNNLYASAKIIIGDTLCKGFDYPYYLSDRIFETTGRGGFIIHPYIKGIEDLFNLGLYTADGKGFRAEGRELVTYKFNNFDYLEYSIDYFLKHEDEREMIKLAGHERTKKDHTYKSRMWFIINTLFPDTTNIV